MKPLLRSIDRPLPVFLAAALVIFLGLWSVSEIPVKRAPQVEIPYSFVVTPYVGAAPADVETEITLELEEQLASLDDLRHITSIAGDGVSTHILEFEDRTDMTESRRSAQDRVEVAQADFPDEADMTIVHEISFDELPIIFFTLRGGADLYRLREIAEDLEPILESVSGVRRVDVFGGLEREVHVLADPAILALHGLTLDDLAARLGQQGRSRPAGQLRGRSGDYLIRATGEFQSLEEIRSITVVSERTGPIALRDVASVSLGHVRRTSQAHFGGEPSVTLIVRRRPEVNTLDTVERLKAAVEELKSTLPPGVTIEESSDSSKIIGAMIRQLGTSAIIGLVLVVLVLFAMFGVRRALLVGSVLPFSLLFTFLGLWVFGMEISNIALFALILVLGLVVDGAIIVGEAIYAEAEAGANPREAAKAGISRVGMPVIAADLTTVAAFLPMLMMVGVMGQFMSVMPKVVAFALIGSVFVDHLLLPAAAARLPRAQAGATSRLSRLRPRWFSPELPRARRRYEKWLARAMHRRGFVVGGASIAFLAAGGVYAAGLVDSIFLPSTDQARFTLNYAMPLGTSLEETTRIGLLLGTHVDSIPELENWVLTTGDTGALATDGREGGRQGPEYGRIAVELVSPGVRERSQSEIVAELRQKFGGYAGVEIDLDELTEGPAVGAALAIRVQGESLEEIATVADEVQRRMRALPAATDVRVDYDRTRPEIKVELDRPRASARFGISPQMVSQTLLMAFHGIEVGRMWVNGDRVDIRLQAPGERLHTIERIQELTLRSASGEIIPLGELAEVRFDYGHNAIFRFDTLRTVTVRADALEGHSSVTLERDARQVLAGLDIPAGVRFSYGGEMEERDRSYASLWNALKWGLLLIYCVIAIQFNSLKQPFIVLLTIPLAVVGVTLGLLLTNTPFSFMVFIGVVALTGIVVNDGIVMVDAINRDRRAGMPLNDAIQHASSSRFRPVLLTTVTTIAGLLPLTLNLARGGEFWVPLGIAIISGLLLASVLTLFVVPVLYSLLEEAPLRLEQWWAAGMPVATRKP